MPNHSLCDPFTRNRTMRRETPGVRGKGGQGLQLIYEPLHNCVSKWVR
jgi:hypothetical protein